MKKKRPTRRVPKPTIGNDAQQVGTEFSAAQLKARLDAIVLLLSGLKFGDEKGRIKLAQAAPTLHRSGYTPTEIAQLFRKKRTDISQYLY